MPGHQDCLHILTPIIEINCTTGIQHHAHVIVARSDEIDKIQLCLRKGKRAVKTLSFEIAVEASAENDLVSLCESIVKSFLIEESHFADGNST